MVELTEDERQDLDGRMLTGDVLDGVVGQRRWNETQRIKALRDKPRLDVISMNGHDYASREPSVSRG